MANFQVTQMAHMTFFGDLGVNVMITFVDDFHLFPGKKCFFWKAYISRKRRYFRRKYFENYNIGPPAAPIKNASSFPDRSQAE
jgi:hypothetical protein